MPRANRLPHCRLGSAPTTLIADAQQELSMNFRHLRRTNSLLVGAIIKFRADLDAIIKTAPSTLLDPAVRVGLDAQQLKIRTHFRTTQKGGMDFKTRLGSLKDSVDSLVALMVAGGFESDLSREEVRKFLDVMEKEFERDARKFMEAGKAITIVFGARAAYELKVRRAREEAERKKSKDEKKRGGKKVETM